jgi:MOSC domain-containing protein YiiM
MTAGVVRRARKVLVFGDADSGGPAVSVTQRDLRCMMLNLDPDTAAQDGRVMRTVVRLNANYAGVYAAVVRSGTVRVGDRVGVSRDAPR